MHCRACDIALDSEDNYCRRCGAPVRVVGLARGGARREVVTVGPSAPALLAGAARPLAAGAATVAAGALVRFAVRRAMRGLAGKPASTPARAVAGPQGATEVTEVFWYRRVSRG